MVASEEVSHMADCYSVLTLPVAVNGSGYVLVCWEI